MRISWRAARRVSLALSPDSVLRVRPLSIVPERDEFLVGDTDRGEFVLLPAIGVEVIRKLASGRSVREVTEQVGPGVDVADFIETLLDLQFVADASSDVTPEQVHPRWQISPAFVRPLMHPVAWSVYASCSLVAVSLMLTHPELAPHASDFLFLDTPLVSLGCVTLIAYVVAAAHEMWHGIAARAAGVDAQVTVSRRLYFLTFETDLSRLWSLPRQRRYAALLAGMAFDGLVLCAVLVARFAAEEGWLVIGDVGVRLLGAVALVQLTAIASQFFIFARTDLYAVLVMATGCVNLWRVNRLRLVGLVRRLSDAERTELANAHPRDLAVARWYGWLYVCGLALAAGYFAVYFLPTSIHLVGWLWTTITAARFSSWEFWSALVLAVLVISPQALSVSLMMRDLLRRWVP